MIKQLTEGLRPTVLGTIKIGDKGGKGGSPRKFEGFKVYLADKDGNGQPVEDAALQAELEKRYGKPLKRVPIFLLGNTLEANFDATYAWWAKIEGKPLLLCHGDGETGQRLEYARDEKGAPYLVRDEKSGKVKPRKPVSCPCKFFNPDPEASATDHPCKWSCKLAFQLADFPRLGGIYLFRSHGLNTTRSLYFSLAQMSQLTLGNLHGIPVDLVHVMARNQRNQPIPVVRIEAPLDPAALRLKAIEQVRSNLALQRQIEEAEAFQKKLIGFTPEADEASDADEDDVVETFYPTQTEGPTVEATPKAAARLEDELASMVAVRTPTQPPAVPQAPAAPKETEPEAPEEGDIPEDLPEPPAPAPEPAPPEPPAPERKRGRPPGVKEAAPRKKVAAPKEEHQTPKAAQEEPAAKPAPAQPEATKEAEPPKAGEAEKKPPKKFDGLLF